MGITNEIRILDKDKTALFAKLEDENTTPDQIPWLVQEALGEDGKPEVIIAERRDLEYKKLRNVTVVLLQGSLVIDDEDYTETYTGFVVQGSTNLKLRRPPKDKDKDGKDRQKKGIMVMITPK